MPVNEQNPVVKYTAPGGVTQFAYPFRIIQDGDLTVQVNSETKTLATDYSVTGAGDPGGGNVVFVGAPAAGLEVCIFRDIPYDRETDYVESGDLLSEVLDQDMDRAVMQVQQLGRELRRSIKMPIAETDDQVLADAASRADKILAFDAQGAVALKSAVAALGAVTTIGFGLELDGGGDLHSILPAAIKTTNYAATAGDTLILMSQGNTLTLPKVSDVSTPTKAKKYIIVATGPISGITIAKDAGDSLPVTALAAGSVLCLYGIGGTTWYQEKPVNATNAYTADNLAGTPAISFTGDPLANVIIQNDAVSPDTKMVIKNDGGVRLFDTTTGLPTEWAGDEVTVNIAAAGANGLDTGVPTDSRWYYLWAIKRLTPSVVSAGLLSLSATVAGLTMPAGYTKAALLGAVYRGADSKFIKILQRGRVVAREAVQVVTNGVDTAFTDIVLDTVAPPDLALEVSGDGYADYVSANGIVSVATRDALGTSLQECMIGKATSGYTAAYGNFRVPVWKNAGSIYARYKITNAGSRAQLFVTGWRF